VLRWVAERRLVLAAGLAAALPIVVATIRLIVDRWAPIGDDALIAVRSFEVLSAHPPLVGMPSTGPTGVLDEQTYHLGPMLFGLLALPARFLGPSSLAVTTGLVGIASVMGSVALAHRRGGLPLMLAVAVAIPLMLASLPEEALVDIWNPAAPLMPFLLLIFVAWSLACGDHRLLPLIVLLASFAAQCHLIYAVPALGALAVGVGGLVLWARHRSVPGLRRWVLAATVVAAVCWAPPVIDELFHSPGNLSQLVRAGRADTASLGRHVAARSVIHTVGVPPWWLRDERGPLQRVVDLDHTPGALTVASAVLVLLGLAGAGVAAARRGRRDVVAAAVLGLVLCAAVGIAPASVPTGSFASLGYGLWWASPLGMWVWVVLAWSALTLARPALGLRGRRAAVLGLAGVAATAAVAVVVSLDEPPAESFREMRTISARVDAAIDSERPVRVDASYPGEATFMGAGFQLGLVYSLLRDGRTVSAPSLPDLGPRYAVTRPGEQVVRLDVDRPPPARGRELARFEVPTADSDNPFSKAPPERSVAVTLMGAP
jgi:hypothetical protein